MKFSRVQIVAAVAVVALVADYGNAFDIMDGLTLLQSYYGAIPQVAPAPPPAPVPPPAPAPPLAYAVPIPMVMPPPVAAPPPALPPPLPCVPEAPKCTCGCHPHHPSCLSMIKPCLHAKLLNLKKKLIEKKLAHLLACCAQFNSHLCSQSC